MSFPIPSKAFDDRLAFVGTAGSGKTYAASGAVEHLLAHRARVLIVDPLGVWWGLRLCADGKTASPFRVVIFGGDHGDLARLVRIMRCQIRNLSTGGSKP